jgi:hypothetical protein
VRGPGRRSLAERHDECSLVLGAGRGPSPGVPDGVPPAMGVGIVGGQLDPADLATPGLRVKIARRMIL